jgi:hypothetical protein
MRDLILKMSISLDGFVGGPDGESKWVFDDDEEATGGADLSIVVMDLRCFAIFSSP